MNKYEKSLINIAEKVTDIEIGGGDVTFLYQEDYANMSELVERATQKKVYETPFYKNMDLCPICKDELLMDYQKFCHACGQSIDWGDHT